MDITSTNVQTQSLKYQLIILLKIVRNTISIHLCKDIEVTILTDHRNSVISITTEYTMEISYYNANRSDCQIILPVQRYLGYNIK